jgi:transposase
MKKRKHVGRKTRCTSQLQKQFCDALAKAHTIKNACVVAGISESAFYQWLAKGMSGEEPYAKFVELVQYARARGLATLVESIITDKDWRAKAWYLERTWPEDFGPVAHRFLVREVPQAPPPAPIITVKHVRVDENGNAIPQ